MRAAFETEVLNSFFLPILHQDDDKSTKEGKEDDEERAETSSPEAEKSQNVEEGPAAAQAVQVRFDNHDINSFNFYYY